MLAALPARLITRTSRLLIPFALRARLLLSIDHLPITLANIEMKHIDPGIQRLFCTWRVGGNDGEFFGQECGRASHSLCVSRDTNSKDSPHPWGAGRARPPNHCFPPFSQGHRPGILRKTGVTHFYSGVVVERLEDHVGGSTGAGWPWLSTAWCLAIDTAQAGAEAAISTGARAEAACLGGTCPLGALDVPDRVPVLPSVFGP